MTNYTTSILPVTPWPDYGEPEQTGCGCRSWRHEDGQVTPILLPIRLCFPILSVLCHLGG